MSGITDSEVGLNADGAPVFKLQPVAESTKQSEFERTATEDQVLLIKQELDKEIEGLEKHKFLSYCIFSIITRRCWFRIC